MNYPTETGAWTPEQAAEAMLCIALEQAPGWADHAWLLAAMAREAAPEDERAAWVQTVWDAHTADLSTLCDRIVATAGANQDQVQRFAHEVAGRMGARLTELSAVGIIDGGRA